MKHLYFVRHGQSEMNKAGRWAGKHTETPLTDDGRHQARLAGDHAKTLDIDHIVSSPQIRARDTAHIIAASIKFPLHEIEVNSLFVERGYGILEGTPWTPDLNIDGFADVETIHTFHRRMHWAYEFLLTLPNDNVLVVSHGAVGKGLRYIIHTLHERPEPFVNQSFKYGEITQLL